MSVYKKILITLLVLITVISCIGWYISSIYEEQIKSYILTSLNNNLNTKVDIEDISFSIFKKFPYATLELKQVRADEVTLKEKKEDLFKINSIYLQFNILDVLNKKYLIEKITVEDGFIEIKIDKKGADNFQIWKADTSSAENPFNIKLSSVLFENISFNFINEAKKIDALILIDQLNFSGNFSEKEFVLDTKANLLLQQLNSNKQNWIKNKKIKLATEFSVNQNTGKYTIQKGNISIEDLKFNLTGAIVNQTQTTKLNITSKGDNLSIQSIFSLFPPEQQEKLKSYKAKGNITYKAILKGKYSFTENPDFEAVFHISNGEILEKNSNLALNQLKVDGNYTNKIGFPSKIEFKNLSANFGVGHISGDYTVTDFNNPYIDFKSIATVDIASAKTFFKLDTLEVADGQMDLNLQYSGYISELNNIKAADLQKLTATGQIKVTNGNLKLINYPYLISQLNGNFEFNNNEIFIHELSTNINKSTISINGSFKNLLAYWLIENQKLLVVADFHAKKIMLDDLLTQNDNSSEYSLTLPQNISFQLNSKIDTFQFRKFEARQFSSNVSLHNKVFTAENINFKSMQGNVKGALVIDENNTSKTSITSTCVVENININELFTQFENFGQAYFVAENIKGNLTSTIQFSSVWDKKLNMDKDKLIVLSNIAIVKGELINYQPAKALGKFIALEELEHIRFSELKTQLEIKNQKIFIPKTEIKSSALDLTLSGTHTFNNEIDYHFKLLMSDLLWKKAKSRKKENSEFGYVEDDENGKAVLFLKMTGTVSNPKISYDTKSLKEKWSADLKTEKQTIKQLLKEEFGLFKNDTTLSTQQKTKKDGFLIEWEEDTRKSEGEKQKENNIKDKKTEKKGLGKIIDKIAQPNEKEYESSDEF